MSSWQSHETNGEPACQATRLPGQQEALPCEASPIAPTRGLVPFGEARLRKSLSELLADSHVHQGILQQLLLQSFSLIAHLKETLIKLTLQLS